MSIKELDPHAEGIDSIGEATGEARSLSLLSKAKEKRDKRENHLFLDVPSWDGTLIAEYEIIPEDELTKMGDTLSRKIRAGEWKRIDGDIELIVRACVGLWVRDPESGDRVMIEDEAGHVGFDRIIESLGVDGETSEKIKSNKDVVKYLTAERDEKTGGYVVNSVAIGMHAQSISRWMKDPSKRNIDIDDLLGES